MAIYLGADQIAECMRSGKKCLARELVRDGRNPELLVLPEWADPAHPQERPYIPDDVEGSSENPIAADNLPPTNLQLAGNYFSGGHLMALRWNIATLWGPRAKWYILRRSTDGGAYAPISTNLVDYTNVTNHVLNIGGVQKDYGRVYYVNTDYTDGTVLDGHIYTYQVAAVDDLGDDVAVSNTVTLNTNTNTVTGSVGPIPPVAATVLLLHMDGANNGVIFTDVSTQGLVSAQTPFGITHLEPIFLAKTTTAQKLFGTASFTDGGGGALRIINNNAIDPLPSLYNIVAGQDFTFEAAYRMASPDPSSYGPVFSISNYANLSQIFFELSVLQASGFASVVIRQQDGTTAIMTFTDNVNISNNVWHRICFQRTGTTYALYIDGTRKCNITAAGVAGITYGDIAIGRTAGSGSGGAMTNGFVDEVRITQGAALYSGASYTVASGPFTG